MIDISSYRALIHLPVILALMLLAVAVTLTPQAAYAQAQADLSISKAVSESQPNTGGPVTYTIDLTNQGPDTAT
ncbi:MAG: DUF11 domain-containing protein, partial [Dehalococcoidia bacterium]